MPRNIGNPANTSGWGSDSTGFVRASPLWADNSGNNIVINVPVGSIDGLLTTNTGVQSGITLPNSPPTDQWWEIHMKCLMSIDIPGTNANLPDVGLRARIWRNGTYQYDKEAYSAVQYAGRWKTVTNTFEMLVPAGSVSNAIVGMWFASGAQAAVPLRINRFDQYSSFYAKRIG